MRDGRPSTRPEALLRQSEERYRALLEGVDEGFCVIEVLFEGDRAVDYRVLEANPAFERQTGLVGVTGKRARELVPDLDDFWFETYGRVALSGEAIRFESHAPAMGRWFDVYARRIGDPASRTLALLFRDVTEQKRADRQLRESESRFREMADQAPAMLWVTDADHRCTFLSRGWFEYTGQRVGEGLGMGWTAALHPEDREASVQAFLEAFRRQEPFRLEHRLLTASGAYRWVLDRGRPRTGPGGAFLGYIGSVIDIHERRTAEEALREADRRKSEFLGVLSHELRNPLAPILNGIHVLERVAPSSPEAGRAKASIRRQTEHLTRLVDDLLDVTRIGRGKIELRLADLDLAALARRTAEDYRALMQERGLELVVEVPPGFVTVNGDETRLAQILGNLLSNAAKFTPAGGRLTLSVRPSGDAAVVQVHDTGAGIDPALLEAVFEPFTQAAQTLARTDGGLGLGLALVKGLAELHGGSVTAESDGPGRGTRFTVTLPGRAGAPPPPDRRTVPPPPTPERRRVLVVDDNRDAAETLAMLIETFGHHAEVAFDGPSAVAKASAFAPDVILCDIGLPGMTGYEVAKVLRAGGGLLVAVSGYAQPEDVARAVEAGFDAHVAKPPDLGEIERLLASPLRRPAE
jgi:PAS domain S-box-containing protein